MFHILIVLFNDPLAICPLSKTNKQVTDCLCSSNVLISFSVLVSQILQQIYSPSIHLVKQLNMKQLLYINVLITFPLFVSQILIILSEDALVNLIKFILGKTTQLSSIFLGASMVFISNLFSYQRKGLRV